MTDLRFLLFIALLFLIDQSFILYVEGEGVVFSYSFYYFLLVLIIQHLFSLSIKKLHSEQCKWVKDKIILLWFWILAIKKISLSGYCGYLLFALNISRRLCNPIKYKTTLSLIITDYASWIMYHYSEGSISYLYKAVALGSTLGGSRH